VQECEALVEQYGFKFPRHGLAKTPKEASQIAQEIGFPVVMKIASTNIIHKIDVGGVELNVVSPDQALAAYERIMTSVKSTVPEARIEGVRVEKMYSKGHEIFIGLEHNAQFGPIIVFGLGGIFAEVLQDVTFRVLPIDKNQASRMIQEVSGYQVLQGYRGLPGVADQLLVDLLLRANRLAMDHADRLVAIDLNPILVLGDEHWVLDAKVEMEESPRVPSEPLLDTEHLDSFFNARSVAVVGASSNPVKIGHTILDSLLHQGYRGTIYPINPKQEQVMGLSAYRSLCEVPGPIDLVVVAIPLPAVLQVIRDCASRGIHNMVIVSGGGKEVGKEGLRLESEIAEVANKHGVRIVGPNCIGIFNGGNQLDTFFQTGERMVRPKAGKIAVLTQSGTVGATLLEYAAELGISKFVSYGNRLDVDEGDLIAYLGDDPETDVIACYIEGLNDGRKFLRAAQSVKTRKPIVVYKSGRTAQAARASISHTGFFGGTYGPWKGAFTQAGVIAVDSLEALFSAVKSLVMQPVASGNRVAMISNGAGPMIQAMDLFDRYDLQLGELTAAILERMRRNYPPYFLVQNPVDVTGSGTAGDYALGIDALLADRNVDIVMPWFVFQDPALGEEIVEMLSDLRRRHEKPIVCGSMGGPYTEKMSARIEAKGVPVFHSVVDWVVGAWSLYQNGLRRFGGVEGENNQ